MVGKFVPNSDRGKLMAILGSHVGLHFLNNVYFEVYEGICRLFKYMNVYARL